MPKVVVVMEEEEVEVPFIDIAMSNESGAEERTVAVDIEVSESMRTVDTEQVFARERRLIVVSRLEDTGERLDDERVRVSDQIVITAPDLDVRHIVIGDRPAGGWNRQYAFVNDSAAARARIGNDARLIYSE